jgi:DNA-binding transcriptional regulator GbsR (MarR family)
VWVRGRGGRRKYYEAETDFWQIISKVLSGREMRDVERAIHVMEGNSAQLMKTIEQMSDEERSLAEVYIQRMSQMQVMFRFAQMVITNLLSQVSTADITHVSRIEIQ